MLSVKAKELQELRQRAGGLEVLLSSEDSKVANEADAQLDQLKKDLEVWANKHNIRSFEHTQTNSVESRRRCKPAISLPLKGPDDAMAVCFLIKKQGRNCLYSCYATE